MARTAVTLTDLAANAGTAESAGTAVDPTNGHVIDPGGLTSQLVIVVKNTAAGAKNATVKAGANPPAVRQGIGDLVVAVPATTGVRYIVVEGSRFLQSGADGGKVYLDLEAAITGTVHAYRMPDTV